MEFLIKAAQLLMSLSILVILHELGHFIPAKLFKTRVEKFYLFFDPWFSVVKKKVGGTEYGIGWLPLGGYVKISGMIDESMDKEQMKKPAESWEFRAKPAWQRLIIMLGGVTVNLLLGIFIYSMILCVWGDKYVSNDSLKNGVVCSDFAKDIGFEDGTETMSNCVLQLMLRELDNQPKTTTVVTNIPSSNMANTGLLSNPRVLPVPIATSSNCNFTLGVCPDTNCIATASFKSKNSVVT